MENNAQIIQMQLETLLFMKGEPQSKKDIQKILSIDELVLDSLIDELSKKYSTEKSGIIFLNSQHEIGFGTHPSLASFVEQVEKEERGGELSKASLETLSIILYKNGATRTEIDYIRGVNSSFILRNLYLRGLIAKSDPRDRSPKYVPTTDLLRFLGIGSVSELPSQEEILGRLEDNLKNED